MERTRQLAAKLVPTATNPGTESMEQSERSASNSVRTTSTAARSAQAGKASRTNAAAPSQLRVPTRIAVPKIGALGAPVRAVMMETAPRRRRPSDEGARRCLALQRCSYPFVHSRAPAAPPRAGCVRHLAPAPTGQASRSPRPRRHGRAD
eukprot:scaffold24422_cov112-Isochrysis_galbana.AAC.4